MAEGGNGTGTKTPPGLSREQYEDQIKAMLRRGGPPGGGFSPYPGFRESGNVEDRRNEPPPSWDSGRLFDPTPLEKSIYPQYRQPGSFNADQIPIPKGPAPILGQQLGTEDLHSQLINATLLRLLGQKAYWEK
jgi:hypothetical protein